MQVHWKIVSFAHLIAYKTCTVGLDLQTYSVVVSNALGQSQELILCVSL